MLQLYFLIRTVHIFFPIPIPKNLTIFKGWYIQTSRLLLSFA